MERFWLAAAAGPAMMSPLFNRGVDGRGLSAVHNWKRRIARGAQHIHTFTVAFSEAVGFVDESSRR